MNHVRRLAIYCGSAPGSSPAFAEATRATAAAMVGRGVDLVYGGGRLGLMGLIADNVLEGGGKVYGVIPRALVQLEVAHTGLTELHTVETMHERKATMTDLADAFLALPGGVGTLDELFEAWSWNALGYHAKPFCLLNVNGFWDGMVEFIDHATESGFLSSQRRGQLLVAATPEEALDLLDEAAAAATQGMVW
ncbi:MAG TPA: TIGR00730 family Rossman fold protein [Sphingomicrobium sp.]